MSDNVQIQIPHRLSIIIPMYTEEDNVLPIVVRIHKAFSAYRDPWELILINDGSHDATEERMKAVAKQYGSHVTIDRDSDVYGIKACPNLNAA